RAPQTSATSRAWCSPDENHRDELFVPLSGSYFLLGRGRFVLTLSTNLGLTPDWRLRCRRFLADYRRQPFGTLAALRQYDFDVRDAAHVTECPSHWRWTNALHAGTVVGHCVFHVQLVDIDVEAFFAAQIVRVFKRRTQQLFHRRRHPLLGEDERIQRIFDLLAFDQIQHQTRLLRR